MSANAFADVRLPALFSDNMVFQRETSVRVWGWADDGEKVTVNFRNQQKSTRAKNGKWDVKLSSLKAGGPGFLKVTGENFIQLTNVLVGEVWICSGQSNMEWPLKNAFEGQAAIDASSNSNLRLFVVPKLKANDIVSDVKSKWQQANPETTPGFSAVGYYFGRDLQNALGVPVGLIQSDWGGSPAEVWMSEKVLGDNPRYKKEILDAYVAAGRNYREALAKFKSEKPEQGKNAPNAPWKPTELYNGMISPLIPYTIKGAIWYQGESNAGRAEQYRILFPDLIRGWREDWCQGKFTFLAVQLAPFMAIKDQPGESAWAELREAQLHATQVLPNVGMAVITDVGEPTDIHPKKKEPVGARLALAARGIAYNEKIVYSGPIYRSMKVRGDRAILSFDHVGGGLVSRDGSLKGFAICGADQKFVWANAVIEGDKIVVNSPAVAKPMAVRFGWADFPVVNLWNKEGLPASPFRTDDFPMTTASKK
ncbi:MAG: sialate O-acetylesterase [Verrucomicrobiota bacterium]